MNIEVRKIKLSSHIYLSHVLTVFLLLAGLAILTVPVYSAESLDTALSELTEQIIGGLSGEQVRKVAVTEFVDLDGKTTEFGRYISEELTTRLFRATKFEVVERHLLNKLVEEHKLNLSGVIDERTAKKFGRLLGADGVCSGTITDLRGSVKVGGDYEGLYT